MTDIVERLRAHDLDLAPEWKEPIIDRSQWCDDADALLREAAAEIERLTVSRDAYVRQRDEVQRYGDELKRHINDITIENQKLREALQLVHLSGGWLHLSEETKTIIIDRLDGGRVS